MRILSSKVFSCVRAAKEMSPYSARNLSWFTGTGPGLARNEGMDPYSSPHI